MKYSQQSQSQSGKAALYILLVIFGLLAGAIGGGEIIRRVYRDAALRQTTEQTPDSSNAKSPRPAPQPIDNVSGGRNNAIVQATSRAAPSVVGIVVTQLQVVRRSYSSDEFFDFFFGPELAPKVREVERMGSGFIFSKEGHIITNYHVVEGAQKLYVTFADGTQLEGHIVGVDPQTDLAVVAVKGENLPCAKLGDSDKLMIGEWAIAIGNPFGFFINDARPTVTVGVISAVDRNFAPSEGVYYQGMIQTDAAINQGNSGGPLLNSHGEVIGINSAIYTPSGTTAGIGFAIPISTARQIAHDLITDGRVHRASMGVEARLLTPAVAEALHLPVSEGLMIERVTPGGPAANAGLKGGDRQAVLGMRRILLGGDVVTGIDGRPITGQMDLTLALNRKRPGDTVNVEYYRDGKKMTAKVTLTEAGR